MRFIPGSAGFGTRRARGGFGGQVLEPCPGNPGNLEGCRCSSDLGADGSGEGQVCDSPGGRITLRQP